MSDVVETLKEEIASHCEYLGGDAKHSHTLKVLRCALAEIERLREQVPEWKPIESAPLDGSIIDLWHKDGCIVSEEWWDEDDNCFCCLLGLDAFTHWRKVMTPFGQLTCAESLKPPTEVE